tara:strand:+ start:1623 stop:2030 length:408 start_codon:yes stop_codon:yes gene_type:complete
MNDLNRVIVFIFCSLILVNIEGQSISPLESIGQLIRLGDSKKISAHLDKSVEITIENNQKLYSKAQAEQILNRFFEKNTPKQFDIVHKSNVKEGKSKYGIGELYTISNKKYRTYFYIVLVKERYLIRELNFEQKE